MSGLTQMVSRVLGGRGGAATGHGRRPAGGLGAQRTGPRANTRAQDEAIGRGVRRVLRRFR